MSKPTHHETIYKKCPSCDKEYFIVVRAQDYADWVNGKLIQDAMPYLPKEERELLISGICNACFKEMKEDRDYMEIGNEL